MQKESRECSVVHVRTLTEAVCDACLVRMVASSFRRRLTTTHFALLYSCSSVGVKERDGKKQAAGASSDKKNWMLVNKLGEQSSGSEPTKVGTGLLIVVT